MKKNNLLKFLFGLFLAALVVFIVNSAMLYIIGQKKAEAQSLALNLAQVNQYISGAMKSDQEALSKLDELRVALKYQREQLISQGGDLVEADAFTDDMDDIESMLDDSEAEENLDFEEYLNRIIANLDTVFAEEQSIAEVAKLRQDILAALPTSEDIATEREQMVFKGVNSKLVSSMRQNELFANLYRAKLNGIYSVLISSDNRDLSELVPAFYDFKTTLLDYRDELKKYNSSQQKIVLPFYKKMADDFEKIVSPSTIDLIGNVGFANALKSATYIKQDIEAIEIPEFDSQVGFLEKIQPYFKFPSALLSYISLAVSVVSLILYLLFNLFEARDKRRQINIEKEKSQQAILTLLDELEPVAEGDLSAEMTVTEDVTGTIADAINLTLEQLRTLVITVDSAAKEVGNSAEDTLKQTEQMTEMSQQREKYLTNAAEDVNRILSSVNTVAEKATESSKVAKRSVAIAQHGEQVVSGTIDGMNKIRTQILETTKRVKRLGESSQEIGDTVALISDIADQTNILALNSAIQASMAGEAGRGFAVVSDEIQRLSEKTNNAAKRIEQLVNTIKNYTSEAVFSMEETTAEVVDGAKSAENAGKALDQIRQVSADLSDIINEIFLSTRSQSKDARRVGQVMTNIGSQTEAAKVGVSKTMDSVNRLALLSDKLRESIDDFVIPEITSTSFAANLGNNISTLKPEMDDFSDLEFEMDS